MQKNTQKLYAKPKQTGLSVYARIALCVHKTVHNCITQYST